MAASMPASTSKKRKPLAPIDSNAAQQPAGKRVKTAASIAATTKEEEEEEEWEDEVFFDTEEVSDEVDEDEEVDSDNLEDAGETQTTRNGDRTLSRETYDLNLGTYESSMVAEVDARRRRDRFGAIIYHILVDLIRCVRSRSWPWGRSEGCSFAFACLLVRADVDWLFEKIMSGIPDHVQIILGKIDLQPRDLLGLRRWSTEEIRLPGCYVDIVQLARGWALYVGSATSERGILGRWNQYASARNTSGTHLQAAYALTSRMNFRALASFPADTPRIFTLLTESVYMVYLQTFQHHNKPRTWYMPEKAFEWCRQITASSSLQQPTWTGLNDTWSISQGVRKDRVGIIPCSSCGKVDGKFRSLQSDHPMEALVCNTCYAYAYRNNGEQRPVALIEKHAARRQDAEDLAQGRCACGNSLDADAGGAHFDNKASRMICQDCRKGQQEKNKGDAGVRQEMRTERKNEKPTVCERPGCENLIGDPANYDKVSKLMICRICYEEDRKVAKGKTVGPRMSDDGKEQQARRKAQRAARPVPADGLCEAPTCTKPLKTPGVKTTKPWFDFDKDWHLCPSCGQRNWRAEKRAKGT